MRFIHTVIKHERIFAEKSYEKHQTIFDKSNRNYIESF